MKSELRPLPWRSFIPPARLLHLDSPEQAQRSPDVARPDDVLLYTYEVA